MMLAFLPAITAAAPFPTPGPVGAHQRHALELGPTAPAPSFPVPAPLPAVTPGPDVVVYGYQAYWDADLNEVPWDDLSHIAIFAAEATTSGGLTSTSRWDEADEAVSIAQPYGVRVHLCVINFSPSELGTLLGSSTARAALIADLASWQQTTGAHGINVDFEGVPSANKQDMVDFTRDLSQVVGEVVLATPAVDWSGAWDYSELTKYADLFIMGYGYHWSGSSQAGPNDPLWGGSPWGSHALSWSVDDYVGAGADPSRVILGLPLYGIEWPVSSNTVPATTTGTGSSVFYAEAVAKAQANGRKYDTVTETPYYDEGSRQGWYSDADSVALRADYAVDEGIGGIGFWALHYDDGDPQLWANLRPITHNATNTGDDDDDDDVIGDDDDDDSNTGSKNLQADAGQPFLAYVGDTVVLSASSSKGAEAYDWKQVEGPAVALSDTAAMEPSFTVEEVGTHVFELTVSKGGKSSAARSYVIVLDPDAGRRHQGCGCATGASPAWLGLLAPLALFWRRRR